VFGSVFCLEHVIPALWLHPLQQPLPVLLVPVAGGAALLALGLALGLLQAWWQQRTAHWLRDDAPLLVVYLGAVLAIAHPLGWGLIVIGVLAVPAGAVWAEHEAAPASTPAQRVRAALRGLGELAERAVQLAINTLSFARVGAFALAHAGLASAVVALASPASHPLWMLLVLVLGNVLILAIEGLVVSIQTTRLVLFEFFTRFFEPAGREFQPLQPPPLLLAAPTKEP
jgi:V/A-type H+-transporting ATPase subunit I